MNVFCRSFRPLAAQEYRMSRNYRSNPQVDKKLPEKRKLEAVVQEHGSVKTAWPLGNQAGRREIKLFLLFFFPVHLKPNLNTHI